MKFLFIALTTKLRLFCSFRTFHACHHQLFVTGREFFDVNPDIGHLRTLVKKTNHLLLLLFLLHLFLFLSLLLLVLLHHVRQLVDVLVGLREKEGQSLVLLLVDQLAVALFVLGHQASQTLFLDSLLENRIVVET
jgi:hypothetical protein